MSRRYITYGNHPIIVLMRRNELKRSDVCEALHVTEKTFSSYLKDPLLMHGRQYLLLSGLFNIPIEHLMFQLIRNRPNLLKADKWYLQDLKQKNKHLTDEE
jgi:hypothetical protein